MNIDHQNLLFGKSALHYAIQSRNTPIISHLLNRRANPNLIDYWGQTPLDIAKEQSQLGIVDLLENHNAKIGPGKQTPLHWAVNESQIELLKRFLGIRLHNSDPIFGSTSELDEEDEVDSSCYIKEAKEYNVLDHLQRTPLHLAAEKNFSSAVKILLGVGVALNYQDQNGNTPLHLATNEGHVFIVKLLCEEKTLNLDLRNCVNKRPIDLAIQKRDTTISLEEKDRYNEIVNYLSNTLKKQ